MNTKRLLVFTAAVLLCASVSGQTEHKWSASLNLGDLTYYYTIGVSGGRELSRHLSAEADLKICPFRFLESERDAAMNRLRMTYSIGLRYWPWHVNSGLWIAAKAQHLCSWQDGALGRYYIGKNDAGLAMTVGYSFMIAEKWNIEAGLGGWAACAINTPFVKQPYRAYIGDNLFLGYNEVVLSLVRLF